MISDPSIAMEPMLKIRECWGLEDQTYVAKLHFVLFNDFSVFFKPPKADDALTASENGHT